MPMMSRSFKDFKFQSKFKCDQHHLFASHFEKFKDLISDESPPKGLTLASFHWLPGLLSSPVSCHLSTPAISNLIRRNTSHSLLQWTTCTVKTSYLFSSFQFHILLTCIINFSSREYFLHHPKMRKKKKFNLITLDSSSIFLPLFSNGHSVCF